MHRWQEAESHAHRAVLADALATSGGILVEQVGAKFALLVAHAPAVAVLGLGAAPVFARTRLAVGVDPAGFACGSRGGRGLSELQGQSRTVYAGSAGG